MITVNQRFIHLGARKMRLVADIIRGQELSVALKRLHGLPQRAAYTMAQIVRSGESAAKTKKIDGPIVISSVCVDEGPAMKRRVLAGRGRATRFEHRMSHVKLTVAPQKETK